MKHKQYLMWLFIIVLFAVLTIMISWYSGYEKGWHKSFQHLCNEFGLTTDAYYTLDAFSKDDTTQTNIYCLKDGKHKKLELSLDER